MEIEKDKQNEVSNSNNLAVTSSSESRISLPTVRGERLSLPFVKMASTFLWNFDIFGLEEVSANRPLVFLGHEIFHAFKIAKIFNVPTDVIMNWLVLMESHYHEYNPYHNATHAADVLQACAYFLKTDRLTKYFDPLDQALSLVASVIHDLDHPGRTNTFLIVTHHELALLYNDKAVLESHHVALAFKLTLMDARVNIFQNLNKSDYHYVRSAIIDMVLATEMVHHYQHVISFTQALKAAYPSVGAASVAAAGKEDPFKTDQNIIHTRRMLIKCSDVSNPGRPLRLSCKWALRVCEEFFNETEEEMKQGHQLTLPYFVRSTCSVPAAQAGFNDFFTINLFTPWHEFVQIHEVMKHLKTNDAFWRRLSAEGITTAADVSAYIHATNPGEDPII